MLEQLRLILQALPWTGPAVIGGAAAGLLSMFLFPRRRSHSDRVGFALLVWCLTVALVVTLSPVRNDYFGVPSSGCNWSVWRPLAREYWFSAGSRPPNVWLLFPAGLGIMLLDGFWRRFFGIAFLVALPPGIETLQDEFPELKRSCSSQDVIDNWTGLAIGLLIGFVLALVIGVIRWIRRRAEGAHPGRADALDGDVAGEVPPGDDAHLPLGGGASGERYADFSDFDDTPRSTRWYEAPEDRYDRFGAASRGGEYAAGAYREGPSRERGSSDDAYRDDMYGDDTYRDNAYRHDTHERAGERDEPRRSARVQPQDDHTPTDDGWLGADPLATRPVRAHRGTSARSHRDWSWDGETAQFDGSDASRDGRGRGAHEPDLDQHGSDDDSGATQVLPRHPRDGR